MSALSLHIESTDSMINGPIVDLHNQFLVARLLQSAVFTVMIMSPSPIKYIHEVTTKTIIN